MREDDRISTQGHRSSKILLRPHWGSAAVQTGQSGSPSPVRSKPPVAANPLSHDSRKRYGSGDHALLRRGPGKEIDKGLVRAPKFRANKKKQLKLPTSIHGLIQVLLDLGCGSRPCCSSEANSHSQGKMGYRGSQRPEYMGLPFRD
jgi:hypothetical protein